VLLAAVTFDFAAPYAAAMLSLPFERHYCHYAAAMRHYYDADCRLMSISFTPVAPRRHDDTLMPPFHTLRYAMMLPLLMLICRVRYATRFSLFRQDDAAITAADILRHASRH